MAGNGDLLPKYYEIIRHNHLCGDNAVEPEMFRLASAAITKALLADGIKAFSIDPANAIVLLPWRAGLAFADAAFYAGFREFYHWGARRNERTLETETYFEEAPLSLAVHPEKQTVIIADPMLATGNTMISATRLLGNYGVPQERIFVLSVISAPEGVDHVLRACPRVRILVGRHDEYLNSRGYIEPGLGDFGDLFFEGLERVAVWRRRGILSDDAARVLIARMTA
jgi:uracil phosphoribosyltransferase